MTVRVISTRDTEQEAREHAAELWEQGKRVGVARTLDWNRWYPNHSVRTVNRFVIYEEIR